MKGVLCFDHVRWSSYWTEVRAEIFKNEFCHAIGLFESRNSDFGKYRWMDAVY